MPSKLAADILNYADQVSDFHTSEHVLDALDIIASEHCRLNVLGAALLPVEFKKGAEGYELGRTVFLHRSVPKGRWEDYLRVLEPIGVDRWAVDLHHKYGMRDLNGRPCRRALGFRLLGAQAHKLDPLHRRGAQVPSATSSFGA